MKYAKKTLSILMAVMMIFASLPMGVFAEGTSSVAEETVYEKGEIYTIDGVRYKVNEDETVTVLGSANGMPEKVELLSYLGKYPVTQTSSSAFDYSKNLKEIIIPETVTSINGFFRTGLEKIQIKGDYVSVNVSVFAYSPYYENEANWKDGHLIIGSCLIKSKAEGEVIIGEEITSIAADAFGYSGKADTIKVYNENCVIPNLSGIFPMNAKLCGKAGSTLQSYFELFDAYGFKFEVLCLCEDTQLVEETPTLCDGTIGYSEGRWCERCQIWQIGHRKNEAVSHFDENADDICDNCKISLSKTVVDCGIAGENAVWTLDGEGRLIISGTGNAYTYGVGENEPWYSHKDEIRCLIAEDGIGRLHGVSFKNYHNLEKVEMADSVLSLPSSFENCTSLKSVDFSVSLSAIDSSCFAGCSSLESIFIPENITKIDNYAFEDCINLRDIDFETGYVEFGYDVFDGTAAYNNPDNIKGNFLYIDNCLIKEIKPGSTSLVLGNEITSIAAGWKDTFDSLITEITVYNPECVFARNTGTVPGGVVLKGLVGSTAQAYNDKFGGKFIPICLCDDTIFIPESNGFCDGRKGYTEGTWCDRCQIWASGHIEKSEVIHIYKDFTVDVAPTCTGYGMKSRHCYCGETSADVTTIDPVGHIEVVDIPAVAPTQTEPGYTHQSHCRVCGEIVAERQLVSHGEYDITFDGDSVVAQKFDAATNKSDGADIVITFSIRNDVCMSNVDKTIIYKVGETGLSKTEFTYNGKVQKPKLTVKDSKGKTLTLDKDYKLTYSANSKYSGNYTVTVDYIGNYAGSETYNYSIVVNPVTPMVEASDTESITLYWIKGHSDLVYRVYSVDSDGNLTKIADTKDGRYEITSLEADTQYKFQVRAYVKGDDGKTYWGEKGSTFVCKTKSAKGIINFLRSLLARFKAILQKIFGIGKR